MHKACQLEYLTNPTATILNADLVWSAIMYGEICFKQSQHQNQSQSHQMQVTNSNTYDFFTDGLFYLLDAPGPCQGHLYGLAQITVDERALETIQKI